MNGVRCGPWLGTAGKCRESGVAYFFVRWPANCLSSLTLAPTAPRPPSPRFLFSSSLFFFIMTTSTTATQPSSVVPSEVGWQFVPQYYTFVNKEPNRLHCFYSKNSTFIHGTEGEDGKPCFGQQEIHNKITSLGFHDCKVFIHSVDAQASANGGIIIQVIGEMSNHGDPWRKFVQTFFLAEQPNGYFVLNDIFRFLKEETVEGDDEDEAVEPEPAQVPAPAPAPPAAPELEAPVPQQAVPAPAPEPVYEPPREPTPPPAPTPEPEPVVQDEAPTTDVVEPAIMQTPTPAPEEPEPAVVDAPAQPNGIHPPEAEKPAPAIAREPTPPPAAPSPVPAPVPVAAPSPAPSVPAPAPTPAAPRSWASLAASNQKKWGSVAQETRGTSETLSNPVANSGTSTPITQLPPSAPHAARPPPQPQAGRPDHQHQHPAYAAALALTTPQCFIKGVTEPVSQSALTTVLTQRFGPVKEVEIVRSKACAFLEFMSVDAARRAIIASLSVHAGGEGGVWIDVGGEVGQVRISVETKKERGERPPARPRGGAPPQGNGHHGHGQQEGVRGGFRGRGGPAGRGRGGPAGSK
ncbi:unnamed protein product [Cyclocybe aegerita]|uniref:G3BP-like protein n=1 Tax=Cyclocybe aegerita TaxID=1973307 RepID=A0A8S0VZV1_CYCAE|nr:unnamed protein product [Cyclocybe aegerita]